MGPGEKIAALVAAAATGAGAVLAWMRWRGDRALQHADTLEKIREQRDEALDREATEIEARRALHRELEQARNALKHLEARVRHLEALLPFALDLEAEADLTATRAVLDAAAEPWGLSSPGDGGRITYANPAFCRALGLPLERVLELPWTDLVHPADLARMQSAEGRAWSSTSARDGHPGRYRVFNCAGEPVGWRQLRFFFSGYLRRGSCRWLARDEGFVDG